MRLTQVKQSVTSAAFAIPAFVKTELNSALCALLSGMTCGSGASPQKCSEGP